jgi:hypothetical protein
LLDTPEAQQLPSPKKYVPAPKEMARDKVKEMEISKENGQVKLCEPTTT